MSRLFTLTVLALTLAAPLAYAGDRFNDTSSEINVTTPDITPHNDNYVTYRSPGRTVRSSTSSTTTYTTTNGSPMMHEPVVLTRHYARPYHTYNNVVETTVPVGVMHHTTVTMDGDDIDPSLAADADLLFNSSDGYVEAYDDETIIMR
jgi:hypothetical protein